MGGGYARCRCCGDRPDRWPGGLGPVDPGAGAAPGRAVGEGQIWTATKLAGTLAGAYKYVSSTTFYCPASSFKATLSGTPS
jgi:hypothetical protein